MSIGETTYDRINDYTAVKISLARPHDIRSWSFGEVKKPETINYRTYRPEKDGLFCERIFGPEKDWECSCGKYRGMKYKGMICDRCGVKVTHSRVRRKRMGHIELAAPVVHIWFFKAMPSRLGTLLDMKTTSLEKIIYFQDYVVTDPGDTPLKQQQLLTEDEYREAREQYGEGTFDADMGAEAVRKLLVGTRPGRSSRSDSASELARDQLQAEEEGPDQPAEDRRGHPRQRQQARVDGAGRDPGDSARSAAAGAVGLGQLRHQRPERPVSPHHQPQQPAEEAGRPQRAGSHHPQREADAAAVGRRAVRQQPLQAAGAGSSNRPLKSLTDMIKGKQGRFRENLLGKRVDYSARSVIVVGPALRLHQCGLPKKIALELFQPFIIRRLKELDHADTIKSAKKMLERKDEEVWDILEEVIQQPSRAAEPRPDAAPHGHPGLRAGAGGRQRHQAPPAGLQGLQRRLRRRPDGRAPAAVDRGPGRGPHADDVDQQHLQPGQRRADHQPVAGRGDGLLLPDAAACPSRKGDGMIFSSLEEVQLAYALGKVATHARHQGPAAARPPAEDRRRALAKPGALIETTVGRVMFNDLLPDGMPFYNIPMRSSDLAEGDFRLLPDPRAAGRRSTCWTT